MKTGIFRFLFPIFAPLLSAVLLVLAFPSYDLGWLAWVSLVPLFIAISERGLIYSFFASYICGALFFAGIIYWITEVTNFTLLHYAILVPYLGSYFGFFGLAFSFILRRCGLTFALLAAPFIWVSMEYVRSNLYFLALPWGLLAHSQYQATSIIQIASFTGAYGVSLLVGMVNSALALAIFALFGRVKWYRVLSSHSPSSRRAVATALATAVFVALAWSYGQITLSRPISGKGIKISAIQGNIDQEKKWDPKYAKFIMQTYTDLTREASEGQPALIVWPETATPRSLFRTAILYSEVDRIVREVSTPLLLGTANQRKFDRTVSRELNYTNSAFLMTPPEFGKAGKQRYDKIKLVPFAEYMPLRKFNPWSFINIPRVGGYTAGKKFTVFQLLAFRFGVTICWENLFPDLVRRFVGNGAQFIVNISNEGYFSNTAAPYQVLSMNVFRAVENRIFVLRCANRGVSGIIDPYGRTVNRLRGPGGEDLNTRGIMTGSVIPLESKTFYTRYGDWLALLSFPCSLAFLLCAFLRKNPGSRSVSRL